jgi:hypothetical protein
MTLQANAQPSPCDCDCPSLHEPEPGTPGSDFVTSAIFGNPECDSADWNKPWRVYNLHDGCTNFYFRIQTCWEMRLTDVRFALLPPNDHTCIRAPITLIDNDPNALKPVVIGQFNAQLPGATPVGYELPIQPDPCTYTTVYLRLCGILRSDSRIQCKRCPYRLSVTFLWRDALDSLHECNELQRVWFTGTDAPSDVRNGLPDADDREWTHPNPAMDRLTIHSGYPIRTAVAQLMALDGQAVLTRDLSSLTDGEFTSSLDVQDIPSGQYILYIESGDISHSELVTISH